MLKSELRKLIREEIRTVRRSNLLTEAFASKKLNQLYSKYKKNWNGFKSNGYIKKLYKKYNIDWANIPDNAVEVLSPEEALTRKNSIIFWVSNGSRDTIGLTIYPGILGVTHGRKVVEFNYGYNDKEKALTHGSRSDGSINNSKRLAEFSDEAYCIDMDIIDRYKNAILELTEKRRQWQGGVFKNDDEFKKQNLQRYKEIIKQKKFESTNIDKLFKEIGDLTNSKMKNAFDNIRTIEKGMYSEKTVGQIEEYNRSSDVTIRELLRFQQDAFYIMEKYLNYEADLKSSDNKWTAKRAKEQMIEYQVELSDLKKKISSIKFTI